jgi:hypothetical protein
MQFNEHWDTCRDLFARVFLFLSKSPYFTSRGSLNMFPHNQQNWISARSITLEKQGASQHAHNGPCNLLFCGCTCNRWDAYDNFYIRNRISHFLENSFHRSQISWVQQIWNFIHPRHWCSDKMNTLQTVRLVMPQSNSIELAPLNRYTLRYKWKHSSWFTYWWRISFVFHK